MSSLFNRRKGAKSTVKSSIQKINEAALGLVASANEGQRGGRLVTKGAALEIVRRSVAKNENASFSVKKFHALKQVSEFIALAQRNKVITASAAHFDLLPLGHPSAKRDHSMSFDDVMQARARWYADDQRVVDDNVRGLLATAFTSDFDTPEYQYALARLSSMGGSRVPIEALVAAALGFNDGANKGFWRQQLRDRNGRFAKMGGKLRKLFRRDGQTFAQYGDVVSTNPNDEKFVMETPDDRLIETEADAVETEVQAILPSEATPDGVSASPVKSSSADPVVDEADLVYVDQPNGFIPSNAAFTPNGMDVSKIDRVWEDDLGNYQVVRGNFTDDDSADYVVSRLEQDEVVPLSAEKRWSGVVAKIADDEPKFEKGDDAEPDLPEGLELSPGPREDVDLDSLTSDELAAGYGWGKSGDKYERDNFEIEQLPDGKWLLTETGEEGASRESGPFDSPADAFEQGQLDAEGPEFDMGQVMDFREDQGPDEAPEPEAPEPAGPDGMYDVDRGPYAPQGPQEGTESDDFTDDPVELAQRFDPEELEGALEESVRNGSGEGLLPFEEGDEYVPSEAMYNALKEQDADPDRLLDDIYEGTDAAPETEQDAPDVEEDDEDELQPITPQEVAEMRGEEELPALLDGLSDDELAEVINNEDYTPYLPQNSDFDAPEGMYDIDPDSFDPRDDLAPEDAPEGAPNKPVEMAVDISSEDLENGLRESLKPSTKDGRLGYAPIRVFDEDGEEYTYDVPAEAWRDALQLQGIDTNEIIGEAYDGGEMEPDEIDDAIEGENIETEEVFGLSQEEKEKLIEATKEGGYTVNFVTGDVPTDGYMVASEADVSDGEGGFKKREEVVSREDFDADPIKYLDEFTSRNFDKLKEDGYYIGTWTSTVTDEETGEEKEYVFFDVSERIEDKEEALQAARDRNEIAIFGIEEFEEFFTDPEREAQKNAGEEAPEGDDESSEQLPGDDGAGTPGVAEGDQPSDSGELEQEEVGPLGRVYDISDWNQVGGQSGSNAGGLYEDADGNQYYVKFPPEKQLRNELLASALYEKAGIPVGRVYLGRDADGNEVLVSPMLENAEPLADNLDDPEALEAARSGFAADAWLNNWDSVGLVFDNMVVADSEFLGRELYRIDAGGALLFRAQGGDKDLPEDVQLIDSLRNPDINQQAATIYGEMTDEDIKFSVQKMLPGATDENIDELVDAAFPDDAETADLLKERLKSRRDYLVERFQPVTPEMAESAADEAAEDLAEQLQDAQEKVDEVFADNPLVLDFDGDIESQVNDALENERDLVFSYNGVDRIVRPVSIETNENTGNTNISAVDGDGNFKKFTISKMSSASAADDLVGDIVGEDTSGDEIETSDSELPQSLEEWEQDLLKTLDDMYSTPNLTSQDVEDLGEQPDVNDDITSDLVSKIDAYEPDAPQVETPEQKVMADAVEQLINPEDDSSSEYPTPEQLLAQTNSPESTEPDIIWQRVQDEFDGTLLPNGHVVVSSTMHGDRRYDVVVRRANNNTFHIYHRVTYPDGSTKVKEMGGQGWHSAEALFSRLNVQIGNSRLSPKTTVNKALKQENDNTLYADTSTPTQPGSYVAADGSVVKQGDRVSVVNPTHSKFGMGARIVSVKRKYSSDGKKYTDYLRVKYDDGTKNNIVSTSVVPEGNAVPNIPAPSGSKAPVLPPLPTSAKLSPKATAENVSPGEGMTLANARLLPVGAVVMSNDGRYYEHVSDNAWSDISNGFGHVFASSENVTYIAPDKQSALDDVAPESDAPLDADALPAPTSWTQATTKANGDALDEFTLPEGDLEVGTRLYTYAAKNNSAEYISQYGFENQTQMEQGVKKYYTSEGKTAEIPRVGGLSYAVPGSILTAKKAQDGKISTTKYVVDSVDFESGKFSVVAITGPDKTKRFVDLDGDDFMGTGKFLPVFEADSRFGVELSNENLQDIRAAKALRDNPGFYSNDEMVIGPGVEEVELESLPDWGQAPGDTTSTKDALNQIRQWDSLGDTNEASQGIYTMMDSTSIEDGQVRIQRVFDDEGRARTRLTGKFTAWFGRKKFVPSVAEGAIEADESTGIDFDFYERTDSGLSYAESSVGGFRPDAAKAGTTYTYETPQGYRVKVHRANTTAETQGLSEREDELDFFSSHSSGNNRNVSLHNVFDVLLPADASSSDVEQALQEMGVTQSRPATDLDVQAIKENKLLTLFGQKRDGAKNASGLLRQQELQKIEKQFGITVDDLVLENDGTSKAKPSILISESAAQRIVKDNNIKHFYHNVYMSDISTSNVQGIADRIVNIFEDGSLQSTVSRMLTGGSEGNSSNDDLLRPGADYTFTYFVNDNNENKSGHWKPEPDSNKYATFIFDPVQMLRRLDFYANEGDAWGQMQGKVFDSFKAMENANSDGEALFKTDVPLGAVRAMSVTPEVRARILALLKERGIDFINGNDVEQMMNTPASDWDWR